MESYDTARAGRLLADFIDDLSSSQDGHLPVPPAPPLPTQSSSSTSATRTPTGSHGGRTGYGGYVP